MWWFWWWLLFVTVLFLLPLGYGWGYRGWGPPYPSRSAATRERRARELAAWGVAADVLWLGLIAALVWLVVVLIV